MIVQSMDNKAVNVPKLTEAAGLYVRGSGTLQGCVQWPQCALIESETLAKSAELEFNKSRRRNVFHFDFIRCEYISIVIIFGIWMTNSI